MLKRRLVEEEQKNIECFPWEGGCIRLLSDFVDSLSQEYCSNPQIFRNEKEQTIWLEYPYLRFECDAFFQEYQAAMAWISREYPIKVCGMVDQLELGELTAEFTGEGQILCRKYNSTGNSFESMDGIAVGIQIPEGESSQVSSQALWEVLLHREYSVDFIPVSRRFREALDREAWKEKNPDTHFAYLQVRDEGEMFFLNTLSLEQKKELWTVFFRTGISPLEFEYLHQAFGEGVEVNALEWNLALHMVVEQEGIAVTYDNGEFRVTDAGGKRLWFGYHTSAAAEKLFLKMLFPEVPQKKNS